MTAHELLACAADGYFDLHVFYENGERVQRGSSGAQGRNRTADTGFSSLRPVWPRPRKTRGGREVEEAAAADLQRIAVLRPRFPRTGRIG